jgi:TonB family protein
MPKRNFLFCLILLCFISAFSALAASAQEISFNYFYKFGRVEADEAPQINGVDVEYPEAARKNGVQGTLKAALILGENGKVRDVKILQSLPHGVEAAVTKALVNLYFKPARLNGQPVAIPMEFDFVVSAVYSEEDKNVAKPKILEKPAPVYPSKYAPEKIKGKVYVSVLFFPDGKIKVLGVNSAMPKEFDRAAAEAAAKIRFLPAAHKKSKEDVALKMIVEYDFKP